MPCLLDTGVLLRLVDRSDTSHDVVRRSVETLLMAGEPLFATTQNFAEFWNVATRPLANNGFELQPAAVAALWEQVVEPISALLVDRAQSCAELKRLALKYNVRGKQIHDARLVASMPSWQVDRVLTLNDRDFRGYLAEGISVVTPIDVLGGP